MNLEDGGKAYRKYLSVVITLILVSSVLSLVVMGVPVVRAGTSSPIAIDGSASTGCGYVTACSVSLTTTQSNDVIIVGCDCWPSGATFSVKDTAGLTFVPRESQLGIGGGQFVETWYAISSSVLSADKVSLTTTDTGETWYGMVAFAVSGANTANPFVSGFPQSQANLNCASPCNTGVSAPAGSFVFQVGGDTGYTLQTAGPGMTLIQTSTDGQDMYAQYEVLSSSITSATLSFGSTQGNDFGVTVDALNPATSSTTSSSSTSTATSMTIDGSASTGCGYVTACSVSLTTTQSNDVIIVGCDCWPSGATFSVKDTAGLTFVPRESQLGIGGGQFVETWYAISPSPLSSDTISVTTTSTGETWYGVVAFAVSGASTSQPFVTGFPQSQANLKCASPCSEGVSAPAGSFVFQVGGDTGYTLQTAGPGMTLIQATRAGEDTYAQYEALSSTLSSATLSFGSTQGNDFGVIVDALNPATSSTTSSSSTSTTSSSSTSTTSSSSTSTTSTSTTAASPLDGSSLVFDETGSNPTITLTTARANDVVILLVATDNQPGYVTISGVTASGLTFSQRGVVQTYFSGAWDDYQEWWAVASSPLSAVVITAHLSGTPYFDTQLIAFGVNGALNPASPFDHNSGLPVTGIGTNCYTGIGGCSVSVSTSSANDFIFGGWVGGGNTTAGSGFTLIQSDGWYARGPCSPGSCYLDSAAEYAVVSSTQSNLAIGISSNEHSQHWLMIADAIVLAA